MMSQLNPATALRLPSPGDPTRARADAVAYPSRVLAPWRQPALVNGLRVKGDRIGRGRPRRHAPAYDEDQALDAALDALARDLGVELED